MTVSSLTTLRRPGVEPFGAGSRNPLECLWRSDQQIHPPVKMGVGTATKPTPPPNLPAKEGFSMLQGFAASTARFPSCASV